VKNRGQVLRATVRAVRTVVRDLRGSTKMQGGMTKKPEFGEFGLFLDDFGYFEGLAMRVCLNSVHNNVAVNAD